jgi:hypothetical protein
MLLVVVAVFALLYLSVVVLPLADVSSVTVPTVSVQTTNAHSTSTSFKNQQAAGAAVCLNQRGSSGTWVQDWDYANRTDYPNYSTYSTWHIAAQNFTPTPDQPFRLATSWRWQDDQCPVREIALDRFCDACQSLGVTRVLMVGDSFTMMFAQSLLSLLGFPLRDWQATFNGRQKTMKITCPKNRLSIMLLYYRRSPLEDMQALDKRVETTQTKFVTDNLNRTIVVANTGAWLQTMNDFTTGFHSIMFLIQQI